MATSTRQALLKAIASCDVPALNVVLVQHGDVAAMDREVNGGLIQAALRTKGVGRMHAVSLLAHRGARVDIPNDFGVPPLFEVLTSTMDNATDRLRALSSLLANGADPNECVLEERVEVADAGGNIVLESGRGAIAALCIAAQVGDVASLELLLDAKAHPDAPSSRISPLRVALRNRQMTCATTLLVRGAHPDRADAEGYQPAASVRDLEGLALLEAAGASVEQKIGPRHETLLQAWCRFAPDDQMLRHLGGQHPQQIWDRDFAGEHAISKLWRRWSKSRDAWIPRLASDWESDLFQSSPAATGTGRPTRL